MKYNYLDTYATYLSPFIQGDISPEEITKEIDILDIQRNQLSQERDQVGSEYLETQRLSNQSSKASRKISNVVNDSLFVELLNMENIKNKEGKLNDECKTYKQKQNVLAKKDQELFDVYYSCGDTIVSLQYILGFPKDATEFKKIDYLTPIYRNLLSALTPEEKKVLSSIANNKSPILPERELDKIVIKLETKGYLSHKKIHVDRWPYLDIYLRQSA